MNDQSILDPVEHHRLMADMESVCQTANVPPQYIHHSMGEWCKEGEIDWVRNFHQYREKKAGLVLHGRDHPANRCMSICGALLRNFIDARLVQVNTLTDQSKKDELPNPTVMIIQNLYIHTTGKAMTSWQIQTIYDILISRMTANRPTVMYVESMSSLASAYGPVFHDHLVTNYIVV